MFMIDVSSALSMNGFLSLSFKMFQLIKENLFYKFSMNHTSICKYKITNS